MEKYLFEKKKLLNYVNDGILEMMVKHNALIAGGTITSLFTRKEINDIDIYFGSRKEMAAFVEDIVDYGAWIMSYTKKAVMFVYGNKEYQAIIFEEFETTDQLFDTFDFTVCMGAFDVNTEQFVLHRDFLQHNSQRLLKFNPKTAFPIISALRVQKYENRGYYISKPDYVNIILACMKLDVKDEHDLKEQLGGLYGYNLDKLVEDYDEFTLDNVIDAISKIEVEDDYFAMPDSISEYDPELIILEILGDNDIKFIETEDESIFAELPSGKIILFEKDLPRDANVIKAADSHNGYKCYKFVKKVGNKLFSHYDQDFEYVVGEVVEAKNNGRTYGRGNGRLYVGKLDRTDCFSYSKSRDSVLIEMEIESLNDVYECIIDDTFEIKKGRVVRVVDVCEYNKDVKLENDEFENLLDLLD
jgi:antitoxin component HigA of HigAB toxin-antitoxin module